MVKAVSWFGGHNPLDLLFGGPNVQPQSFDGKSGDSSIRLAVAILVVAAAAALARRSQSKGPLSSSIKAR